MFELTGYTRRRVMRGGKWRTVIIKPYDGNSLFNGGTPVYMTLE